MKRNEITQLMIDKIQEVIDSLPTEQSPQEQDQPITQKEMLIKLIESLKIDLN
jgi:hypothetical protein